MLLASATPDLECLPPPVREVPRQGGTHSVSASDYDSATAAMPTDKEVALAAVSNNGSALHNVLPELLHDRDIVLAAVRNSGISIKYAPRHFRADFEIVMAAVRSYGLALVHAAEELRGNADIAIEALAQSSLAMHSVSPKLLEDKDFILRVVARSGGGLTYLPAAYHHYFGDKVIIMTAITTGGYGLILETISDELRDDPEVVEAAIETYPFALEYASQRLRNDYGIVKRAIEINPSAFRYASDRLRNNDELAMMAVSRKGTALRWVSARIKHDRKIALAAVKNTGKAYHWVNGRPRFDKEIVVTAVATCAQAYLSAPEELQKDWDVTLSAMTNSQYRPAVLPIRGQKFLMAVLKTRRSNFEWGWFPTHWHIRYTPFYRKTGVVVRLYVVAFIAANRRIGLAQQSWALPKEMVLLILSMLPWIKMYTVR